MLYRASRCRHDPNHFFTRARAGTIGIDIAIMGSTEGRSREIAVGTDVLSRIIVDSRKHSVGEKGEEDGGPHDLCFLFKGAFAENQTSTPPTAKLAQLSP